VSRKIVSGTFNVTKPFLFQQDVFYPDPETELLCDTSVGAVTINLLPISELKNYWGFVILVNDLKGNALTNNITVNATGGNTINGLSLTNFVINTNGGSLVFQPVSVNQWVVFSNGGGGGGGGGDKNFVYSQIVPSTIWTVNHNLNKRCAVQVVDNAFKEVETQILWNDNNTVTITTNKPSTGFVYCN
jgi:hypothetical protein